MFDERRQRVTGIDKSYPLQPIPTRTMSNGVSRSVKATPVMKLFRHFSLSSLQSNVIFHFDLSHYMQFESV